MCIHCIGCKKLMSVISEFRPSYSHLELFNQEIQQYFDKSKHAQENNKLPAVYNSSIQSAYFSGMFPVLLSVVFSLWQSHCIPLLLIYNRNGFRLNRSYFTAALKDYKRALSCIVEWSPSNDPWSLRQASAKSNRSIKCTCEPVQEDKHKRCWVSCRPWQPAVGVEQKDSVLFIAPAMFRCHSFSLINEKIILSKILQGNKSWICELPRIRTDWNSARWIINQ